MYSMHMYVMYYMYGEFYSERKMLKSHRFITPSTFINNQSSVSSTCMYVYTYLLLHVLSYIPGI